MSPDVLAAAGLGEVAVLVAAVVVAVAVLAAVWFVPRRYARRWEHRGIEGSDLAEVENGFRSTLVQLIGGVALLATIAATWIQISDARRAAGDARRAAERTLALTERGQVTERFTRAIASLGATGVGGKEPLEQRLGGIYGLRRVALDAPAEQAAIVEIMVAYLREHHVNDRELPPSTRPDDIQDFQNSFRDWCGSNVYGSAAPDAEAALQVAGTFGPGEDRARGFDLTNVDLHSVRADGAHLERTNLRRTLLGNSRLENADLSGARLTGMNASYSCLRGASLDRAEGEGVDLRGSNLARASLQKAILERSNLDRVCLGDADLQGARLYGIQLVGADLTGANLEAADLHNADLADAHLTGANLSGTNLKAADLRGARGLTDDQVRTAKTNRATRLPVVNRPASHERACNKR